MMQNVVHVYVPNLRQYSLYDRIKNHLQMRTYTYHEGLDKIYTNDQGIWRRDNREFRKYYQALEKRSMLLGSKQYQKAVKKLGNRTPFTGAVGRYVRTLLDTGKDKLQKQSGDWCLIIWRHKPDCLAIARLHNEKNFEQLETFYDRPTTLLVWF